MKNFDQIARLKRRWMLLRYVLLRTYITVYQPAVLLCVSVLFALQVTARPHTPAGHLSTPDTTHDTHRPLAVAHV